jgi:hypothetical protein
MVAEMDGNRWRLWSGIRSGSMPILNFGSWRSTPVGWEHLQMIYPGRQVEKDVGKVCSIKNAL